ncbi:FecR family protein [Chitinophaga sp. YR573]|uniref:FecR family protein n=1 Tax=Chitinophaga sp. YR573 TaxID=1881040 RepID=UPI0008CF5BA3|nr:FecR family protein [Chitinophaga sp. YR573]SEW40193.1 FecR family protein [Chitinophaga sp. YR573]
MKETEIDQLLYVAALISKQRAGTTLKDRDQQVLNNWLAENPANVELLHEVIQVLDTPVEDEALKASANRVYEAIGFITPQARPVHRVHFLRNRWWWAAALLIGITTVTYLTYTPAPKQPIALKIKPGKDVAILTLADGTTITLDSASNGIISQQGNVRITKLPTGELVYTPEGSNVQETLYNTMTTPKGGQYKLTLPDGSKVWLNAASSITYPAAFAGKERTVTIKGEVYFEVAKNENMPFHVKANNITVDVLGTSFNIMAYEDEPAIKTTLITGAIKVNGHLLKPGQQAVNERITDNADIEEAIAWKNGLFEFNQQSIVSIMQQISRWYDVDIQYQGTIKSKTFTGQISRYADITTVLKMMELTGGIHFKVSDRTVTAMP